MTWTTDDILRLADECEESAKLWAHEIDTRQRAAAELRRLHVQAAQDEAMLWQALEALELRCGTHADERKKLIPALRERLGEGAAMIYDKETGNE
jgi:hypothetical protein